MLHMFGLFCLCCWHLIGVFAVDKDEVSVMEGDSVTLNTGVTEIHQDEDVLWKFGAKTSLIAEISKAAGTFSTYDDGRFRNRLKLDHQTGSLTITNITTEHTGRYEVQRSGVKWTSKTFRVSVHARLPVPNITRVCSSSSSPSSSSSHQYCSLLCSVVNVSHVSLSWYKGNRSLSSISVSDLNRSISLDVDHQDKSTYICVVNNSISNQTQHLDISPICQSCLDQDLPLFHIVSISAAAGCLLIVVALVLCCVCRKCRKTVETQEEDGNLSALCKPTARKTKSKKETVYENVPKKR